MKKVYLFSAIVLCAYMGFSQTTYQRVYNILQANCTGTCHTQANPNNLILTGTASEVRTALFDVTPTNVAAAAKGYKLVDPGNPRNSFLFAKLAHGLDANLSLAAGEGNNMPDSVTVLTQTEREMVRQWILWGAKDTGTFVNETDVNDFYVTQGGQPRIAPVAPPAPNEGVQIYFGPLFVKPGVEIQDDVNTYIKNNLPIDVTKFTSVDNPESHHFAIFKFLPGHDALFPKGMNVESTLGDVAALWYNTKLIAQYPKDMNMEFPTGTAMYWDTNTVLKLSYHMINYNDSILAAEGYLNIYYRQHLPGTVPVLTEEMVYHYNTPYDLTIPNNGVDTTFRQEEYSPDSAFLWNVISIQGHTHKLGTDYNVWTRNANGTKGDLVYDGSYSSDYSYDQGVYIWNNPPYHKFDNLLQVDMRNGFIHEATFNNSGPDTVHFGITTFDEMFITFIMYFKSDFPSAIGEEIFADDNVKIYPNPMADVAYVKINEEANIEGADFKIYNLLGSEVKEIKGINERYFKVDVSNLANGTYTYRLSNGGRYIGSGKVIVQH